MFGKWHLGSNLPYRPIDRGFDEWLGKGDGGVGTTDDYFFNDRVNDHFIHNGERDQPIAGWEDEVFFNSAINFIRSSKKAEKPFFVYLPTYSVHHPVALPDPSRADDYKKKVDAGLAFFFASIEKVDAQIGRLRATLAEEGLDRDTILIFMTDNGGTQGVKLFNAGMQGKAAALISEVAASLAQMPNKVAIRGHTDAVPFQNQQGRNNWSLSAERAEATRQILQRNGIKEERFKRIEGVADTDPFNPKDKFDPRNRRMSITVLNQETK
jgi:arylsulfatase A-like enzyme